MSNSNSKTNNSNSITDRCWLSMTALEVDNFFIEHYVNTLGRHERGLKFIGKHLGLSPGQAVEQRIGFSDRTIGKEIPSHQTGAGRQFRVHLQSWGWYNRNGHEALRGCVTVPQFDRWGKVIRIHGFKINKNANCTGEIVIPIGTTADDQQPSRSQPRPHRIPPRPVAANEKPIDTHSSNLDGPTSGERANENVASNKDVASNKGSADAASELTIETSGDIIFRRDDRRYRVRGLEKNMSLCQLKVNLMASRHAGQLDELVHLDTLDLVKARARTSFIKATANELYVATDIIKKDIGQLLLQLETVVQQQIEAAQKPENRIVPLTQTETDNALTLLRGPNLLRRIVTDMETCGMVGEETNKLVGYLAAVSRLLERPLAIVIQSSSSAGKTSLMDGVLAMMPPEEQLRFSGMTGQSLFYLDADAIQHKTLAISEEEGIAEATYALKLLQSEGELRHATVGKSVDGRTVMQTHHVKGPAQIFLTSTAMEIDEELLNRCLVLTINETRQQTDAIQQLQRTARTAAGHQTQLLTNELRSLHQNAQRLLRPVRIYNPYATQLTFANDKTRLRRDHQKYLTLIETITLLHQHQRPIQTETDDGINGRVVEYLNVTRDDIRIANDLAAEVLGRSLDELAPQTRNLLLRLHEFVQTMVQQTNVRASEVRFTRRDVRESIAWSDFQVRTHLTKLVDLEYVLAHRGKNGQRYVYELLYSGEGREGEPFLMGLTDPSKLKEPATPASAQTPSIENTTLSPA